MTLATEPTAAPVSPEGEPKTLLETWSSNERMRHIPPLSWIIAKLDGDLRRRIDLLWSAFANAPAGDERRAAIELEFRALCRSLDRLADVARRPRGNPHPPGDLGQRVQWGITHTLGNLNTADAETFGRRFPFQTFERSYSEPLWAAALSVINHVHRLTEGIRALDPGIDERLYEGLVVLDTPLDPRPIA